MIVYIGYFFIAEVAHIFGLHISMVKVLHYFRPEKLSGYILGDFFTISSGHPDARQRSRGGKNVKK
jgi:hypothetical protein